MTQEELRLKCLERATAIYAALPWWKKLRVKNVFRAVNESSEMLYWYCLCGPPKPDVFEFKAKDAA